MLPSETESLPILSDYHTLHARISHKAQKYTSSRTREAGKLNITQDLVLLVSDIFSSQNHKKYNPAYLQSAARYPVTSAPPSQEASLQRRERLLSPTLPEK
mmetsp:Transcript_20999/g.37191  ORF Transcript_20999/g.37191 Transcript_20999/m.37191 type:complete len:101 (+) Transcript_20999:1079-1381(+)